MSSHKDLNLELHQKMFPIGPQAPKAGSIEGSRSNAVICPFLLWAPFRITRCHSPILCCCGRPKHCETAQGEEWGWFAVPCVGPSMDMDSQRCPKPHWVFLPSWVRPLAHLMCLLTIWTNSKSQGFLDAWSGGSFPSPRWRFQGLKTCKPLPFPQTSEWMAWKYPIFELKP